MQPIYAEGADAAASTLLAFLRGQSGTRGPRTGGGPLTARELQVADLIAEGLTNADIAKTLRVSVRTVDTHVEHIRTKLGVRARAQIAVWARLTPTR
jgi:DNA-binding NarL/FixJ family response regulator